MKISLLHPSRSRAATSFQIISEWLQRAGMPVEVIVSIDTDDPQKDEYLRLYAGHKVLINPNRSAVDAVNVAAKESTGDVLIVVSDDFRCPRLWALVLEKHLKLKRDFLFKVNDGTQSYIVTLPIMDRVYYNRFGYIYHSDYLHMFADTHLTHVADILRRLVIRNDLLFSHEHYSVKRRPRDPVSIKADKTWDEGKRIYIQHVKNKFGLGKDVDVWQLSPEGQPHKEWLKRNGAW